MDAPGPFAAQVRRRADRRDALLLAVAPVVLLLAFALPPAVRLGLAFDAAEPTLLTALAASYVHLGAVHLLANLLAYLLLAPVTYLLCLLSGRRTLFLAALVTFLVAFPPALSGLQLAAGGRTVTVGFSGINAALFGLFVLSLAEYARSLFPRRASAVSGPALFFLGLAIVAALAVPSGVRSVGLSTAAVLSGLLYVDAPSGPLDLPGVDAVRAVARQPGYVELTGCAAALFVGYPLVAFPTDPVAAGGVVNLYAHLLGFCLAFIATYVASLVAEWDGGAVAVPA